SVISFFSASTWRRRRSISSAELSRVGGDIGATTADCSSSRSRSPAVNASAPMTPAPSAIPTRVKSGNLALRRCPRRIAAGSCPDSLSNASSLGISAASKLPGITNPALGLLHYGRPLSLINSNKGVFGNGMPACLAFDLTTGRFAADGQVVDREREYPKMIMMQPMATRRAWAAVAGSLKIIDCLLEPKLLGIACRALGKRRQGGGD